MKYLRPFEWIVETFEERIGEPDELEGAVGKLAMNFSDLEHTVDRFSLYVAKLQPARWGSNPATLSFKRKVDLLTLTISELKDVMRFNTGPADADEYFGEIRKICFQADALYREVMSARWGRRREDGAIELRDSYNNESDQNDQPLGALDAHKLLDIADFICVVEFEIDQFFLDSEDFIPEAA